MSWLGARCGSRPANPYAAAYGHPGDQDPHGGHGTGERQEAAKPISATRSGAQIIDGSFSLCGIVNLIDVLSVFIQSDR